MTIKLQHNITVYAREDSYDAVHRAVENSYPTVNIISEFGTPMTIVVSKIVYFSK